MNEKRNSMIKLCAICVITAGLIVLALIGVGKERLFSVYNIRQGLDLKGGVSIIYEASKEYPTAAEMSSAYTLIRGRLDRNGYTEAPLSQAGGNRFQVDIPGVSNAEQAIKDIGKTAMVTFCDPDMNLLFDGAHIKNARREAYSDNSGVHYVVSLEFDDYATAIFAEATAAFIDDIIYIMLDDEVLSNPVVPSVIADGRCHIEGGFTAAGAEELAALIRAGSLPFSLEVLSTNNVGAQLGESALRSSIYAGLLGLVMILIFLGVVYKVAGLAANLALLLYSGLILVIISAFELTLTLPGIAGIVLSISMAIDANIIIFERLREELSGSKRSMRSAIDTAYKRAFSAILDSNVTTLISGVVLYLLGSGSIKGYAVTLSLGVVLSMFTAIFVTRQILKCLHGIGINKPALYGGVIEGASR